MLDHVDGFELADETTDKIGTFNRRFTGPEGELVITGFAVETPPGAETLFAASPRIDGLEFIDHPSIPSARWIVPSGVAPGENGLTELNFATHGAIFMAVLTAADPSIDGPGVVEAVARAQVAKAGPVTDTDEPVTGTANAGTDVEARLGAMIPEAPPAGYGLDATSSVRLPGFTRLENDATADAGVVAFLDERAKGFTAAWAGAGLSLGAGISKYPYTIFAASDLAQYGKLPRATIPDGTPTPPRDAVVFARDDKGLVGVAFRRGDALVLVLADYVAPATASAATSLADRGGQPRRTAGARRRDDGLCPPRRRRHGSPDSR